MERFLPSKPAKAPAARPMPSAEAPPPPAAEAPPVATPKVPPEAAPQKPASLASKEASELPNEDEQAALVAKVTKALDENTMNRGELFALCRSIDDIKFTEKQLSGEVRCGTDNLQKKLRDWLEAQHERDAKALPPGWRMEDGSS